MQALDRQPRRRNAVKKVRYEIMNEAVGGTVVPTWLGTLHYLLVKLPNLIYLKIPRLHITDFDLSIWLDTKCRFEVLHIGEVLVRSWSHLLHFYANQSSIRELSVYLRMQIVDLNLPSEDQMARVLPNLTSISGDDNVIKFYVPGRPITKVSLDWHAWCDIKFRIGLEEDVFPSLRQSTASITQLRLPTIDLDPQYLQVIVDALPALENLQITDRGDSNAARRPLPMPLKEWLLREIHDSLTFEFVGPDSREYPQLTPFFVETVFTPLAQLRALKHFKYQYSRAVPTDAFTTYNLSQSLLWRYSSTSSLLSLQINHMTLIKDDDGGWTQKATSEWMGQKRFNPFPWRD